MKSWQKKIGWENAETKIVCASDMLHRLIDLTARHRKESELESERLCSAQQQAERLLESRERSHRHHIKQLEEQVSSLTQPLLSLSLESNI